jgi:hypothetical protein
MALTTTTKLQAVNIMLATIGSAPVNTLSGSNSADVAMAQQTLDEVSLTVQSHGWHFNTDEDRELTPDPITGQIVVGSNIIMCDIDYPNNQDMEVVLRGTKLFDKKNQTYQFSETVKAKIVTALEWDDLPQPARSYIMIRAARIFQDRVVGSEKHHTYTLRDEIMALSQLKRFEGETGDYTIFDNYDVARVIDRRYPYQF